MDLRFHSVRRLGAVFALLAITSLSGCGLNVTYRRLLSGLSASDGAGVSGGLASNFLLQRSLNPGKEGAVVTVKTAYAPDRSYILAVGGASDAVSNRWVIRKYSGAGYATVETIESTSNVTGNHPWGSSANAVAIAPDGTSFVVVGNVYDASGVPSWVVCRYSGAGFATKTVLEVDASFAGGAGADAVDVAFAPDSLSFAVAGYSYDGTSQAHWTVRRYSGAGFTTQDMLQMDNAIAGGINAYAQGIAIAPDGSSIVAVGWAADGGGTSSWIVRRYSGAGFATIDPVRTSNAVAGGNTAAARSVAFEPNGSSFVVVGIATDGGSNQNWVVERQSGAGFASTVQLEVSASIAGGSWASPFDVDFAPDGSGIVVVGQAQPGAGTARWTVRLYDGAGFLTATQIDSQTAIDGKGPNLYPQSVSFSPDSAVFSVSGLVNDGAGNDYWTVRTYSGSGTFGTADNLEVTNEISGGTFVQTRSVAFAPDGLSFVGVDFSKNFGSWMVRRYSGSNFSTVEVIESSSTISGGLNARSIAVAFAPDGLSFVVVGVSEDGSGDDGWTVRRYSGAGFATITTIDFDPTIAGGAYAEAQAVSFAPDGSSFVVAGYAENAGGAGAWTVRRYSGAGFATITTLENSESVAGGTYAIAHGIAFAPDGLSFSAVGYGEDAGGDEAWLVRRYSGAGFATITTLENEADVLGAGGAHSEARAIAYAPDGSSIVVGGKGADVAGDERWVVRRYSGAGFATIATLDSWGSAGEVATAHSVSFAPDSQSVVIGGSLQDAQALEHWVVKRYSGAGLATIEILEDSFGLSTGDNMARVACVQVAPSGGWYLASGFGYDPEEGSLLALIKGTNLPE